MRDGRVVGSTPATDGVATSPENGEDPVVTGSSALACHGRSRTRTWDLFLIREAL
jgi:hypothetical protein